MFMELLKHLPMIHKASAWRVQCKVKGRPWRPWSLAEAHPYFVQFSPIHSTLCNFSPQALLGSALSLECLPALLLQDSAEVF